MTPFSGNDLLRILCSDDPVLIVSVGGDERIFASNDAAAALFRRESSAMRETPLRTVLPNIVAGAIAVEANRALHADDFVRARARIAGGTESVTIGAVRGPPQVDPWIAVFVRLESRASPEPSLADLGEKHLKYALHAMGISEWRVDLRTNSALRSNTHAANFGYAELPEAWNYQMFLASVHSGDRERVKDQWRAAISGLRDHDIEFRVVWPDGSIHWLWSKGQLSSDLTGKPISMGGILLDVSERKRAEESLRLSALAMASTADGVAIADARDYDFPLVYVNDAFQSMTGYTSSELIGRNCRFLHGTDTAQPELKDVRSALATGESCRVTMRNYRKDGTLFWNRLTLSPVRDEADILTHFIGVVSDVTNEKHFEAELLYRATHDPLTGLPNQQLLEEQLQGALQQADDTGSLVAIAFIDVDRLKLVNDSLGHAGGDVLIRAIAARLRGALRPIDTVARYGGDEFVIVYRDVADSHAAEELVSLLRGTLSAPVFFDGVELTPSASVGVALYPRDATSAVDLIRFADTAMYAVKRTERGTYRFFDRGSMRPASDSLAIENALKQALLAREFKLAYQPIYDAQNGKIVALEALLRWHHPERGAIPPGEFIPLAEESGLIVPIGEWVIREICRQHRAWATEGLPLVPISANVSIAQLRRSDFSSKFQAIIDAAGVAPKWIVLEITESIVMDNAELFVEMLRNLRAGGTRISIDDFGTGFSSLRYLTRLSLDTLKIDKSFVDDITTDANAAAICDAIITLAHSVGLTAVAEGVETAEQAALLRELGCDELQGFYFARPSYADATALLLDAEREQFD